MNVKSPTWKLIKNHRNFKTMTAAQAAKLING